MYMINTIQQRLRILVLLFAAFTLFALAGCGSEAPGKSTITVTTNGSPIILNWVSVPTITAITTKTQKYRVSVADSAGLPLNGIPVNFLGQFTNGVNIDFGGAIVSEPESATVTQKTDDYGFLDFEVTAPYYAVNKIHVPYNQSAVGSDTGGFLLDGWYYYTVTAVDFAGETEATAPIGALVTSSTGTGTSGSVTVTWSAVPGATGYIVYGRVFGSEGGLISIVSPATVTWVDTGTNTPLAPPCFGTPAACNNTGLSLNSVIGTAQATSGTALSTFSINF